MKLETYLSKHRITQEQFAAMINVDQAAVSLWTNGRRFPRPPLIKRITEATHGKVSANDFVTDDNE